MKLLKILLLSSLISVHAWAAIAAATVWEVRPTNGNDTNGGGFVTGASGTDFSQQNAKNTAGSNISTTDVVTTGVATITSATANFSAAIVGNIIFLSGTGVSTGWFQVITFTNSTTIILDRSPGTGTGGTMNIGGALQTLGQLNTNLASGNNAWVKAESTITTATGFVFNFLSNITYSFIAGYTTTRGDNGQVTIQASGGTSFNIVAFTNNGGQQGFAFQNFIADSNTKDGVTGFNTTSGGVVFQHCKSVNVSGATTSPFGFTLDANGARGSGCIDCLVTAGDHVVGFASFGNNTGSFCIRCQFIGNTSVAGSSIGFEYAEGFLLDSIAANNTGAANDGFQLTSGTSSLVVDGCIAYSNGRDGFRIISALNYPLVFQNSIAALNGGVGFDNVTGGTINAGMYLNYNATFNNTASAYANLTPGANAVTLTADPFVNGSGNNFALNATTGGGAAANGKGNPGALQLGGTGFLSIGALQPATTITGAQKAFPIIQ